MAALKPQSGFPRRKRHWLQYSLRAMLLAATFTALALGLWVDRARKQQQAVEVIRRCGGAVRYDYQLPGGGRVGWYDMSRCESPVPRWLRDLVGIHLLHDVVAVDLSYSSVTDDELPCIGRLVSLKWLDLGHTRVCGRGFHRLGRLENLEVLILTYTPIRDEALRKIEGLDRLDYVNVHGCRHLTPKGLGAFQQARPNCDLGGTLWLRSHWRQTAR
jgi:hypothetical protein